MFDVIDLLNGIIKGIGDTVEFLIDLIPWGSPFDLLQNVLDTELLSMINYFIPIPEMIALAESWGIAIAFWYLISVAARWLKLIQ